MVERKVVLPKGNLFVKDGKLKGQSNFIHNKKYSYGKIVWLWMSN